ncbi:hypothetical protein PVAP13_5KG065700 [Panicum virgatum]|uniref:Uncharacterized protein n=1 Tax=Panicum virgatum TaxID=38727 RepID=A0A8T0SG99_PANVG|nr:hypothetical protein PVAP13_5KG065700 [Panicum virgatum]
MVRHHCRIILGAGGDTIFFPLSCPSPSPVSVPLPHPSPPSLSRLLLPSLPSPPAIPSPSLPSSSTGPLLSSCPARRMDPVPASPPVLSGMRTQRRVALRSVAAVESSGRPRAVLRGVVARSGAALHGASRLSAAAAASSGRPRAARCGAGARSGAPSRCRGTPLP